MHREGEVDRSSHVRSSSDLAFFFIATALVVVVVVVTVDGGGKPRVAHKTWEPRSSLRALRCFTTGCWTAGFGLFSSPVVCSFRDKKAVDRATKERRHNDDNICECERENVFGGGGTSINCNY